MRGSTLKATCASHNAVDAFLMSTTRARQLRSAMSPAEVRLWSRLRKMRSAGCHFRRQAPFRGYYLDFVAHAVRLVIEVDGSQHTDDLQVEHDTVRDRILTREGYTTLRFTAGAVMRSLDGVLDEIQQTVERRLHAKLS